MAARAAAHAQAMAKVAADYPADDDAQAFYALALLATLPRGDAALPLRRQAGAIAEQVFARNPKHPGAAHYILHAYDHGTLAAKALPAARARSEEHTSELQSQSNLVCRLLLEKKKKKRIV